MSMGHTQWSGVCSVPSAYCRGSINEIGSMSMKLNVPLMQRTLDQILTYPEQWDQRKWIKDQECGTTACFAGWALLLDGYALRSASQYLPSAVDIAHLGSDFWEVLHEDGPDHSGRVWTTAFSEVAACALGMAELDEDLMDIIPIGNYIGSVPGSRDSMGYEVDLFDSSTTLEQLVHYVERMIAMQFERDKEH